MSKSNHQTAKNEKQPSALVHPPAITRQWFNPPLGYELKTDPNHPYLKQRGLNPDTIAHFGLGYCATGPLARRIAIPIHNVQGDLVGYAGRWVGDPPARCSKYKFLNKHWNTGELFNLNRVLDTPSDWPLILVQGFFDVMKLWQMGCHRVVGIMDGTLYTNQLEKILWNRPPPAPIIVLFDGKGDCNEERDLAVNLLARYTQVRYYELKNGLRPEDLTRGDLDFITGVGKAQS